MAGALSGNAAVVQSVVGEITDETNQAIAFPLTGLSWSFGCIIGPMIGYGDIAFYFFLANLVFFLTAVTLRILLDLYQILLAKFPFFKNTHTFFLASSPLP